MLVMNFEEDSGIDCTVRVPEDVSSLEPARAAEIYHILRECLANVARHSGAGRVEIRFTLQGGRLHLTVRDDGVPSDCVVNFDNIHTLSREHFRRVVTQLSPARMIAAGRTLSEAAGC